MRDLNELFDIFFSDDQQGRQLEKHTYFEWQKFQILFWPKRTKVYEVFHYSWDTNHLWCKVCWKSTRLTKAIGFITPISKRRCWCKYFCPNIRQFRLWCFWIFVKVWVDVFRRVVFTRTKWAKQDEWPNLAMMSERYQLSGRASAAVANASLKDAGLIVGLDKTCHWQKQVAKRKRKIQKHN